MKITLSHIATSAEILLGVGAMMFATSCSKDVANNITTSTICFSPDTLQEITAEDIWYPADSIYAEEFSVLYDSLLLIKNKRHDGPYIEVFNLVPLFPKSTAHSAQAYPGKTFLSPLSSPTVWAVN